MRSFLRRSKTKDKVKLDRSAKIKMEKQKENWVCDASSQRYVPAFVFSLAACTSIDELGMLEFARSPCHTGRRERELARVCVRVCASAYSLHSIRVSGYAYKPSSFARKMYSEPELASIPSHPPPLFLSTHFFIAPSNRSLSLFPSLVHFFPAFLLLFSQRKELEIALESDSKKH